MDVERVPSTDRDVPCALPGTSSSGRPTERAPMRYGTSQPMRMGDFIEAMRATAWSDLDFDNELRALRFAIDRCTAIVRDLDGTEHAVTLTSVLLDGARTAAQQIVDGTNPGGNPT